MLLLIHQCQHDIKVSQGGEIIQAGWRQQLILDWRLTPIFCWLFPNSQPSIPDICHFLYANTISRPGNRTPKKRVNLRQKLPRDKTA